MGTSRVSASARAAVALAALFVLTTLAMPVSAHIAGTKQRLREAQHRLRHIVEDVKATEAQIGRLRRDADQLAANINEVEINIADTRAAIDAVNSQIEAAHERLDRTQTQLDERVRVAFETGRTEGLEFILGATSLSDLADRLAVVEAAANSDRMLIEEIEALQADLRIEEAKLQNLEARLTGQRAELRKQQQALLAKLREQQDALRRLQGLRAEAERLVARLDRQLKREQEERRRQLAELRAALAAARRAGAGDGIPGPLYVCPVDEPRAFADDFGAPRYSGGYHPHAGNDIFAPEGTPVRAPFAGTAANATNYLGGLSVKVYGARGYVYNAHLSRFGQLGSVQAGTVIGYVGASGNADGTSPHNHFEWHPGNGGPVNPYPFLLEVCG